MNLFVITSSLVFFFIFYLLIGLSLPLFFSKKMLFTTNLVAFPKLFQLNSSLFKIVVRQTYLIFWNKSLFFFLFLLIQLFFSFFNTYLCFLMLTGCFLFLLRRNIKLFINHLVGLTTGIPIIWHFKFFVILFSCLQLLTTLVIFRSNFNGIKMLVSGKISILGNLRKRKLIWLWEKLAYFDWVLPTTNCSALHPTKSGVFSCSIFVC